jgi:uncharacterized protein
MFLGTLGQVIVGGALIGLALATLHILTGRVMSTSGMIGSLLGGREGLAAASIAFIAGLFISPFILISFGGVRQPPVEEGWPLLVVGGLLVGFGARLGSSSVIGSIFGVIQRSRRAATVIVAIIAGVSVSSLLRHILAAGGAA